MTTITQKIEQLGYAEFLGVFDQDTPEWHESRAGISGSDIGAITGKSPWTSPYTLWARKSGYLPEVPKNMMMRLGQAFETPIIDIYREEHPLQTIHFTGTWASAFEPTWKANPDAIIEFAFGDLGILEIKFSRSYWDRVPEQYVMQVQWYMHILGLKRAIIASVAAGEYSEWEFEYDEDLMRNTELDVRRFQRTLRDGTAPEWDGSQSTYETVRTLSPGLVDGETELGNLWVNLSNAKANYDDADRVFNAYKSATLAAMDGTKIGTYDGKPVIALQARNGKPFITFK